MKAKTTSRVDVMFRAFSDRTRLRILHLLRGGELCVCDLVDVLGVPQPKISRHLAYLRRAGSVVARKDGLWCHYRLARPATRSIKSCWNAWRAVFTTCRSWRPTRNGWRPRERVAADKFFWPLYIRLSRYLCEPSLRKCLAEMIGTFALVLAGTGAIVSTTCPGAR